MAVVADLVINKPLGLSPKGIEFKRAHLYDINPVGVGAMGAASVLSMRPTWALFGADGAGLLGGDRAWRWRFVACAADRLGHAGAATTSHALGRADVAGAPSAGAYLGSARARAPLRDLRARLRRRGHGRSCPAYGGPICSLCCTLDARCHDLCKPQRARAGAVAARCCAGCCRAPGGRSWTPASAATCC